MHTQQKPGQRGNYTALAADEKKTPESPEIKRSAVDVLGSADDEAAVTYTGNFLAECLRAIFDHAAAHVTKSTNTNFRSVRRHVDAEATKSSSRVSSYSNFYSMK